MRPITYITLNFERISFQLKKKNELAISIIFTTYLVSN